MIGTKPERAIGREQNRIHQSGDGKVGEDAVVKPHQAVYFMEAQP